MMITTAALGLAAALGLQQQTDTTVAVPAGTRLELNNVAGTTRITSWSRGDVRIQARHGERDRVEIELRGSVLHVRARRGHGLPFVDYDVTVPRGMPVEVGGVDNQVTVEGVGGDLSVSSVEGDILVRGAGGAVQLNTVEGDITLEGGRGRIAVNGVDGDISITGARGDLRIETVEGGVTLVDIESASVDVGTVEGDISYGGTVQDGGSYRLTSHDGDIAFLAPAGLNATVSVATFDGTFEADPAFRVQVSSVRPGRRFSFTLGSGSARIELETFDGAIQLRSR